jgi:hypothetical protein
MLPAYVILETWQAVEYFIDHMENLLNAHEFLVEVLHDLIDCMEEWDDRDVHIRNHIEYLLYEHGFLENCETECALIRSCVLRVADSIVDNVIRHGLHEPYGLIYNYHDMLGYNIVLVRGGYTPKGANDQT